MKPPLEKGDDELQKIEKYLNFQKKPFILN
jgi:hypothetical protein